LRTSQSIEAISVRGSVISQMGHDRLTLSGIISTLGPLVGPL
jgi:hypothetical protein